MTLLTPVCQPDLLRASRIVLTRTVAAMALLGILAALPVRLEAQCTLSGSLKSFEPNPPGASRPITLSSGFNNFVALYQDGASGPRRLLMEEAYGYSVLDLSNPVNPTALYYHDVRFPLGGLNSVTHHGDGQSNIQTMAVSPDGQRVAFSTTGPAAPFQTVVGSHDGGYGFTLWGDFPPDRAFGTVIQHIGGRYIAYSVYGAAAKATDITALPTGSLQVNNMAGSTETTTWSEGADASLVGNYILYEGLTGLQVIDASNPGPVGSIAANYPRTTILSADFGVGAIGRTIAHYSAAIDPVDATKLWVLVEFNAQTGENSPSYGLLTVSGSLAKVSAGPVWRVPSQPADVWSPDAGTSSALIRSNGDLFVLMWAQRSRPSLLFDLYSTTVAAWGSVNTSAPPGVFGIPPSLYGDFSAGHPMRGFSNGSSIYAYLPAGSSAYVIPMSCVSQNAPAVTSMTVINQATGAALNSGDFAFLGDTITITPSINPPTSSQPLTGFGWNFDLDFHSGVASEDNGASASPRLHAPDNAALGSPANPPALITIVGPCDPQVGGTSPGSGAGCWNSVKTNGAFGGPDFAASPSTKALTFAFEANNSLGSAGASLFTLNWKVPAAKVQTTQILAGATLVSTSDGNPTAYQWAFGPDAQHLTASCTTSSCAPPSPYNTRGVYAYSLTAKYFVDQAFTTSASGTYTVTDFAPSFTVNGSATGGITAITSGSLAVLNSSQRGATVNASGYFYSLCDLNGQASCPDNYVPWAAMSDAPPSGAPPTPATIPVPANAGSKRWALKIKVSYTGGTAFWPDPAGAASFLVNVTSVSQLGVTVSASPPSQTVGQNVTFSCNVTGGLAPYSYQWNSPIQFPIPGATNPAYTTTASSAGAVTAYCFVTDSQPTPATSSGLATATFTGGGGGPPGGNLAVNVSVSPNPGTVGLPVTFSCNASGGTPPYTYSWRSPSTSPFVAGTFQTYQTSSSTPTTIQAGCTATDSVGAANSNVASVQINDVVGPPATCVDANFTILDRDNGFIPIPLTSAFGIQYFGVAVGQNLAFQASGTGINTVDWTFGDGGTAGNTNPAWYTYTTAGTFNATVRENSNAACSKSYSIHVAGPSGLFTARYADGSQFISTSVTSGKDLSFVATDTATSYAWDFGDGVKATGKNATHAFRVSGTTSVTFTTTLTVTIGSLNWSTSQNFTVLPPPEPPKWFVAGMAYLKGALAGTLWQTDVTVFNPDPIRPATYSLAFLDGATAVDPANLVWKTVNVGAQHSLSSPNILAFFGLPLGSHGALLVRGDAAPVPPVITSRTFNIGDPTKGTFGLSVPSTQPSSGLTPQAALAQQFLIGLRDDKTAYTNIGLMNLTTDWSHARLTFLDGSGATSLGQVNVDVPPYGVAQLTRPLTAAPPNGVGFAAPLDTFSVKVSILSGGAVFPYATVIDLRSTDSIVATASDHPSSTYRMPGIIRLQGANNTVWRSRFYVTNPSTTSRQVTISYSFIPCDATGSCKGRVTGLESDVTLLPGETLWADDFPKVWLAGFGFDVSETTSYASSYVDVFPAAGDPNQEPLLVLGETYNDQPGGPVGLQVPGFTDADAASKTGSNKRLLLAGLVSNASYRTNVALFLQSGTSGRCTVRVLSDTGVELAHQDVGFGGATTFVQINDSVLFGSIPGNKDRLAVVIDSVDGSPISSYATIVDNTSGDATFLKAQPAP